MQNKTIIKRYNKNYKPSEAFDNLIKKFMSPDFVLTENNLLTFFNKLHSVDYTLKYKKLYSIQTINDMFLGGYVNHKEEKIALAVNKLINLSADATNEVIERYKLDALISYFHETRHEKQLSEIENYLSGREKSVFPQIYLAEMYSPYLSYEPINSLIEIDARFHSLKRLLDLEKRGVYSFNPKSSFPVMLAIVQMLDGINQIKSNKDLYVENPFKGKPLLKKVSTYTEFNLANKIIDCSERDFLIKFYNEYSETFKPFFETDFKYLINKMLLNHQPSNKFKMDMLLNYKIDFSNKELWEKLITMSSYMPDRGFMYYFYFELDRQNKDKNDIEYHFSDLIEYYKQKGITNKTPDQIEKDFSNDLEKHKEFEKILREKHKNKKQQENEIEKELNNNSNKKL